MGEKMKEKISVVIPCYKCEDTILYVINEIVKTMQEHQHESFEVILVDDGSPDNTFSVLEKAASQNKHLIAVELSRNFGQHSALMAAYSFVTGDYIVGMDDDGEHDPRDMFKLIDKLQEGFDYVCASFGTENKSLYKRLGSKLNNWMATNFIGKPHDAIFSSYYVMRRFVVDKILETHNPNPYIGGMIVSVTQKLAYISLEKHCRISGESGYHFRNSVALWINGVTAFSIKPLRCAMFIGTIISIIGFFLAIFFMLRKILVSDISPGFTSIISVICIIGGLDMIILGMIGEYVGRIYMICNHIPQYSVRKIVKKDIEK